MAPELIEDIDTPWYSTKSDMFAFGMVLWEMAANSSKLFRNVTIEHIGAMFRLHKRENIPSDTPSEYRTFIERCWEQDPKYRPEAKDVILVPRVQGSFDHDADSLTDDWTYSSFDVNSNHPTDMGEPPSSSLELSSPGLPGNGISRDPSLLRRMDTDTDPNSIPAGSSTVTLTFGAHIGSGGFGTVYRGTWGIREVAVKKFNVTKNEAKQEIEVQNEINMLQHLRDRYVIQFLGTDYHDGMLVIIMDYAEGGNLRDAIEKHKLERPDKIRITQEMARGLAFIHEQKVLHRDLKSLNVLLTRQMEVKLCDFGLATVKMVSVSKTSGNDGFKGTIRWTAPELFARRPKYPTKSDMFALGMMMWEMAANCTRPFMDQLNSHMVILLIERGEREDIPDDTPADYRAWIERCWHEDPARRPEAVEMFTKSKPVEHDKLIGGDDESTSYLSLTSDLSRLFIASPSSASAPTNEASA